jgi:hypothetical protein
MVLRQDEAVTEASPMMKPEREGRDRGPRRDRDDAPQHDDLDAALEADKED